MFARRAQTDPLLARLKITEEGIDWRGFEARIEKLPADEVRRMLDAFVDDFFEALASLIGRLIVAPIFQEAKSVTKGGRR